MATVRLFANLREAAGTGSAEVAGSTVGEVLDNAAARFGDAFAAGLDIANVWVNGTQADRTTAVGERDEVALIPPVSGGATTLIRSEATPAVLVIVLAITLALANADAVQTLTFAVVGLALAWIWDVHDTVTAGGEAIAAVPSMIAVTVTANATYRWGTTGFASAFAATVVVVLIWNLFSRRTRTIESMAIEGATALIGVSGVGALVMMRLESETIVNAFLIVIVLGAVAAWAVERFYPDLQGVDPNLAGAVGALLGAVIVGLVVETFSPAVAVVAAAGAIAGMFAGRSLLSLVRIGIVSHTTRSPGVLSAIDGATLSAAGFWLGMLLFG